MSSFLLAPQSKAEFLGLQPVIWSLYRDWNIPGSISQQFLQEKKRKEENKRKEKERKEKKEKRKEKTRKEKK